MTPILKIKVVVMMMLKKSVMLMSKMSIMVMVMSKMRVMMMVIRSSRIQISFRTDELLEKFYSANGAGRTVLLSDLNFSNSSF